MFGAILNLSILALAMPLSALAAHHGPLHNRRHAELAKRSEDANVTVSRRAAGSSWTFYNVETGNAGSCGQYHSNSDFTVAMNVAEMNPSLCFKQISMTYNGQSTVATISDTCPGCKYGGLDLTEGLFSFFAPMSQGVIIGDWEFVDAAPSPTYTPPAYTPPAYTPPAYTPPATTSTPPPYTPPAPATTSTWVAPTPSTSSTWNSTSLAKPSSVSSVYSSSSDQYSGDGASALAAPSGISTSSNTNNLEGMNQAFVALGGLVLSGGQVS